MLPLPHFCERLKFVPFPEVDNFQLQTLFQDLCGMVMLWYSPVPGYYVGVAIIVVLSSLTSHTEI